MSAKHIWQLFIEIILTFVLILYSATVVYAATPIPNAENQYMELKVVSVNDVDGADKQVIMEWWSHDLKFKGVDLRFSYDENVVKPSSISDNSYVDFMNGEDSFEFAGDFASYMGYFTLSVEDGEYRCIMTLDEKDDTGTYIENDSELGYLVNTEVEGGVLLGRMSFRLSGGELSENTFALKPAPDDSPTTGIKIDKTSSICYENTEEPSVFRFTMLENKAEITKIQYDFFNDKKDGEEEPVFTYKDLDLTAVDNDSPEGISKYTLNVDKNWDNITLQLEKLGDNAKVKIGEEEIDITKSKELVLNKLGAGDTIIDILLVGKDDVTIHTYRLVIHKPYGTIKGSIQLGNNLRDSIQATTGTYVEYIANATVYEPGKVNWDRIIYKEETMDKLDTLEVKSQVQTDKDDGSYTLYVMPGQYDLVLERLGFLANVTTNITISEGQEIDLGQKVLIEGDANRDGMIDLNDLVKIVSSMDSILGDGIYLEQYDFGQKGFIDLKDLVSVVSNMDSLITIQSY